MPAYGVLVIGASGTGKSYAMRDLNPASTVIINIQGKKLPFKGGNRFNNNFTIDEFGAIMSVFETAAADPNIKTIVVDDFQYFLLNTYTRKHHEKGFEKYADIGVWTQQLFNVVKLMRDDQVVYFLNHESSNEVGDIGVKVPCGKFVVEKVVPEGMFTMVLRSVIKEEKYLFQTQNEGRDVCKSPEEMFTERYIPNSLSFVNESIIAYENGEDAPAAPTMVVDTQSETKPQVQQSQSVVETPNQGLMGGAQTQPETQSVTDTQPQVNETAATPDSDAQVDKTGIPWDERIHSSNRQMTTKGIWQRRRNITDATFQAVVAELNGETPVQTEAVPVDTQPEPVNEVESVQETQPVQDQAMDFSQPEPEPEKQSYVNTTAVTREDKISSFCAHCGTEEIANKFLTHRGMVGPDKEFKNIDELPDQAIDMIYLGMDTLTPEMLTPFK